MAEQLGIPAPFMRSVNPRKWSPPKQQIEDALAGNSEINAPVTFVGKRPTLDDRIAELERLVQRGEKR